MRLELISGGRQYLNEPPQKFFPPSQTILRHGVLMEVSDHPTRNPKIGVGKGRVARRENDVSNRYPQWVGIGEKANVLRS